MRQPAVPPHVMGVLAMASGVLLVGLEIVTAVQSAESTPHATFTPVVWYRFEDPKNITIDSGASGAIHLDVPNCTAHIASYIRCPKQVGTGGPVGGFLDFAASPNATVKTSWGAKIPINISDSWDGFTIEFLLKPGPRFLRGGYSDLFSSLASGGQPTVDVKILATELQFFGRTAGATAGGTPNDGLVLPFAGQGVLAYDYLVGNSGTHGGWHHIALVKDATSGNQSVWIDGVCAAGMSQVGNATGGHMTPAPKGIVINSRNSNALDASVDEIAVYNMALPGTLIHLHYEQALNTSGKPGEPYSNIDPGGPAPNSPALPTTNDTCTAAWCYWDLTEYPAGTQLPSPAGNNNTVGGDVMCVSQMQQYAGPRYNTTAIATYGTPYNFNWMDPHYMAGATDPLTKKDNVNLTVQLMDAMATRWRYGPMLWSVGGTKSTFVPTALDNLSFALFNAHPEWPMNVILPFGGEFHNETLPAGCYLQNAAGHFIDVGGQPATTRKSLRPMSPKLAVAQGCPDTLWAKDGLQVAENFKLLTPYLTRPFSILNLDGEVFVSLDTPAEDYNFSHDPTVLADFKASEAPNWLTYWSEWRVRLTNAATDPYMTDKDLTAGLLKGAKLTMYQVQGDNGYFGNWTYTRKIMSPMTSGRRGSPQYYSTVDLYMPSPHDWWVGGGPNHGMQWLELTRKSEIKAGDVFNSPFIAAGWSGKAEHNIRPGQWLGLVKIIAMWGAEFFYTGFFNVNFDSHDQMPVSGQWCWQGMMPSYAQAVLLTQAADFFYKGEMVMADANTTYGVSGAGTSPWLWAGQPNVIAVARRVGDAFLVTLAVQRGSNAALNLERTTVPALVGVPGIPKPFKVSARLQGSVYVYRNDTSNGVPVLYQLDTWHQASHPSYWPSTVVEVEAEMFEGHLSRHGAEAIRTDLTSATTDPHDFTLCTSYVDLGAAHTHGIDVVYNLTHLEAATSGEVRVRARRGVIGSLARDIPPTRMLEEWSWVTLTTGLNVDADSSTDVLSLHGTAQIDRIVFMRRE